MPARIRLQRHGKKGRPFFHIVVADGRAPRDGKFIERLGTYNPMTNPATVELDVDKAVKWMRNGAQPSDTVRSVLSHQGAMLKHHLLKGVDKGALTAEQAEAKFAAWVEEKAKKTGDIVSKLASEAKKSADAKFVAEQKVNEAKATALAKKLEKLEAANNPVEETVVETPVEETLTETTVEETVAEAPATEETPVAE